MSTQLTPWQQENTALTVRGIDEPTWNALKSTIYPGAKDDSIIMAVDYCRARKLDPMLKPVHLVPMQVTVKGATKAADQKVWRDVPMPGIGLYRIQADRSGNYAGAEEPEFGPTIAGDFTSYDNRKVIVSYPEWCKFVVTKIVSGEERRFVAKEYWLENYASVSSALDAPNAMWAKRPFAQLAKCAEAQALRRGWPEIGSDLTAEEMAGKTFDIDELRDVSPPPAKAGPTARALNPAKPETVDAGKSGSAGQTESEPLNGELAGDADTGAGGPVIKPGQVNMVNSKLARHPDSVNDFLATFQIDCVESLPASRINDAMEYFKKLGK